MGPAARIPTISDRLRSCQKRCRDAPPVRACRGQPRNPLLADVARNADALIAPRGKFRDMSPKLKRILRITGITIASIVPFTTMEMFEPTDVVRSDTVQLQASAR